MRDEKLCEQLANVYRGILPSIVVRSSPADILDIATSPPNIFFRPPIRQPTPVRIRTFTFPLPSSFVMIPPIPP